MIIKIYTIPIIKNFNINKDKEKVITAYQNTFEGPPWFENWNIEDVSKLISEAYSQKGFKGLILEKEKLVLGFAFGYSVPNKDTKTVKFSKINRMLLEKGWQNSFYLAECGVIQNYQNKNIGNNLISKLKEKSPELIFRTTNPNMIKVIEKQYSQPVEILFNDPIELERNWYGVRTK